MPEDWGGLSGGGKLLLGMLLGKILMGKHLPTGARSTDEPTGSTYSTVSRSGSKCQQNLGRLNYSILTQHLLMLMLIPVVLAIQLVQHKLPIEFEGATGSTVGSII